MLKIIDTKKIVYIAFDKGSIDDFTLLKNGTQNRKKGIPILGDRS